MVEYLTGQFAHSHGRRGYGSKAASEKLESRTVATSPGVAMARNQGLINALSAPSACAVLHLYRQLSHDLPLALGHMPSQFFDELFVAVGQVLSGEIL